MREQINEILYRVASETIEKLAFVFSFPEDERDDTFQGSVVTAGISFTGTFSGNLIMTVSTQVLPELAANMLGIDEEETTLDQQHDSLKELINVICGNLLPAIAGEEVIFNIGAPRIITQGDSSIKEDRRKHISRVKLTFEKGQSDLLLFVEGEIPEVWLNG